MDMALRLATSLAFVLILSGCSTPAPPTITPAQEDAFRDSLENNAWRNSGLPDSERPDLPRAAPVSREVYFDGYGECLAQRTQGEGAPMANYICQRLFQLSTNDYGYFSVAQRDGIYDYFQRTVVPCLAAHGYDVGTPPPRDLGASGPGYLQWSPFWTLGATIAVSPGVPSEVCPEFPSWAQ